MSDVQQMCTLCVLPTLHRLGYASSTDVIDVKGRVACEISSGDELLLTELLFNGVFNNLTAEQSVALLSCFVFQEKVQCYMLKAVISGTRCLAADYPRAPTSCVAGRGNAQAERAFVRTSETDAGD